MRRAVGCVPAVVLWWAVAFGVCPQARAADHTDVDTEARVQYSYYTADARALQQIAATLDQAASSGASATAAQSYLVALVRYRQAQLALRELADKSTVKLNPPDNPAAARYAKQCLDVLEQASLPGVEAPETLGMQAACSALLGRASLLAAPLANSRSASQLRSAALADARNPRVRLIAATVNFAREIDNAEARPRLRDDLLQVAALFELERRDAVSVPSWGGAEAYWYLARVLLAEGDGVAARSAVEQALLLAPDFVAARELVASIVSAGVSP